MNEELSYIIGFIQADGNIFIDKSGNRRMTMELSIKDKDILERISLYFNNLNIKTTLSTRTRDTNYCKNYTSATLSIYNKDVINNFIKYGVPAGKKSNIISIPTMSISEQDYWRGMIDGDGSLGFRKSSNSNKLHPFISLVISSEELKNNYLNLISRLINKNIKSSRNKRDNVYNIVLSYGSAIKMVSHIYYDGHDISLNRKSMIAEKIKNWKLK